MNGTISVRIGNTTHLHDAAHLSESPEGKQEDRVGISPGLQRRMGLPRAGEVLGGAGVRATPTNCRVGRRLT